MSSKTRFHSLLPGISIILRERYESGPYFWRNDVRESTRDVILQQTLSGSAAFWKGGHRIDVPEGWAMIFRHGEASSYGLDESSVLPYELRWALLTGVPGVDSLCGEIVSRFGPVVRMEPRREASLLFARLQKERDTDCVRDRLGEAESTFRLLLAIYREQLAFGREDPVAFGKRLLENEFRSPRNIKEFTADIGLSREHFTRAFRERYGESPADFLRRLRLEYARQLAINPALKQKDIAAASGFSSPATFRHSHTREYGHPPGALVGSRV